ncbi:MAG: hypothetical protein R2756_06040 [Bacteroidales bacterium]
MKTRRYILFLVAVAVLFTTACEDFLVKEPRLSQSNELTLSTFAGLDNVPPVVCIHSSVPTAGTGHSSRSLLT